MSFDITVAVELVYSQKINQGEWAQIYTSIGFPPQFCEDRKFKRSDCYSVRGNTGIFVNNAQLITAAEAPQSGEKPAWIWNGSLSLTLKASLSTDVTF